MNAGERSDWLENRHHSHSQILQDLFVLSELDFKQNGYFVDFGATNGMDLSNSFLLEKKFGWQGICAEPARCWHAELKTNRNCIVETDCVWRSTGQTIEFNETVQPELSTLGDFSDSDFHAKNRKHGQRYSVGTISLNDLLEKHQAPEMIDYLSIDTEGSEFEILKAFDFSRRKFRVITCEHNFSSARKPIHDLLQAQGYVRKYEKFSRFDDWFVLGETEV